VAQAENFRTFRASAATFDGKKANELGLSETEILRLDLLIWEFGQNLNRIIAAQAHVERLGENEVVLAFHLDDATSERLKSDFAAAAIGSLGAERWAVFAQSELARQLDFNMDHWGRSATAYRVERSSEKMLDEPKIKIDLVTDLHKRALFSSAYPQSTFETVYGPLAAKALSALPSDRASAVLENPPKL
jgi:hypothetical protein